MTDKKIPVVVMAASRLGEADPIARFANVAHKTLLPIRGVPMIQRVTEALTEAESVGPIWIAVESPDKLTHLAGSVRFLPSKPSLQETVSETLKIVGTPCLVTTGDHALLRPEWVEEFLTKIKNEPADVYAAVALKETVERDVPNTKRTYLPLSDMRFSGCNLFYFANPTASKLIDLWGGVQRHRKNPLKMARVLGFRVFFKALLGRLSMKEVIRRAEHLTGARLALVTMDDGRMAVDVDKLSDIDTVNEILAEQPELR